MAVEEEKAGSLIHDVLLVAHPRNSSAVKGQDPGQLRPPWPPSTNQHIESRLLSWRLSIELKVKISAEAKPQL